MRIAIALAFPAVFAGFFGSSHATAAASEVNLYTSRPPELIQPALDAFTQKTGIAVNVLYLDKGLIERMRAEAENSPADVILTVGIDRLGALKQAGLTQTVVDAALDKAIPEKFRDPDGQWFGLSMDARVLYASKARVASTAIAYEDLAKAEWKGRICIRDGRHATNIGLFADMIGRHGEASVRTWLAGLKANLNGRPSGNDRSQAEAIAEGKCDIAIGDASMIGSMLTGADAEEKAWADAVRIVYPAGGSYGNISGMALAKYAPDRDAAVKLMTFLASAPAQQASAARTFEFPVAAGALPADALKAFGVPEPDKVPVTDIVRYRDKAADLVDQTGFNDGPGK